MSDPTAAGADDAVWIDPEMAEILAAMRASPAPPYERMAIPEAREAFARVNRAWNIEPPQIFERRELEIPTRAGGLRARLYRPDDRTGRPLAIYIHGGGWTFGSIETHDRTMAALAADGGFAVLGIDYRLAPEFPYPAAIEDILDTLEAVRDGRLGNLVDPTSLALIGDSAGAALALSALIGSPDLSAVRAAVLVYGCYAPVFDTASHRRFGNGDFPLTTDRMRWYWKNYLGGHVPDRGSLATPSRCDLSALPPLLLVAAGLDSLRDETFELAKTLGVAGNSCKVELHAGVCHGFFQMTGRLAAARRACGSAAGFIGRSFAGQRQPYEAPKTTGLTGSR
jgi:acetyl esterase